MLSESKGQDDYPWLGLNLACVRILQLYCKVFEHPELFKTARKSCNNCKCSRESHEVVVEHGARTRLGFAAIDGLEPRSLGYSFVPPGLTTARQVDQFYSLVPAPDVPRLGTKGEVARTQRLLKQLPRQDLSLNACKFVEAENKSSYQDFITARNEIALDVGVARLAPPNSTCVGCNKSISSQQACVSAPRMGNNLWHPACFKCVACEDLLVDLSYCVHDDSVYCERHYAEQLKPRCASCDEVGRYIQKLLLHPGFKKKLLNTLIESNCSGPVGFTFLA